MKIDNDIIRELQSAAEWFSEHGRNTNTAIIGICKRAIETINHKNYHIAKIRKFTSDIRAEAIKEFWNRLSENADTTRVDAFHSAYLIKDEDAENLIKEMTEQRGEGK